MRSDSLPYSLTSCHIFVFFLLKMIQTTWAFSLLVKCSSLIHTSRASHSMFHLPGMIFLHKVCITCITFNFSLVSCLLKHRHLRDFHLLTQSAVGCHSPSCLLITVESKSLFVCLRVYYLLSVIFLMRLYRPFLSSFRHIRQCPVNT